MPRVLNVVLVVVAVDIEEAVAGMIETEAMVVDLVEVEVGVDFSNQELVTSMDHLF